MSGWIFLGLTSTKQRIKCLAQGHNAVSLVRLKPATPRSRVKHSTTEPPASPLVRALRDKKRSRAIWVPIYGDLYQNLQWSLTFNLKVVTHLKSASEASYDVINMATIIRNCPLIKAVVCAGMVIFIQRERFFNIISIILVIWWLHQCFTWLWQRIIYR